MPLSSEHRDVLWTAVGISACFYLLIVTLVFFTPTNQAMWDQALGSSPYGIPQRFFLLLWITAICLPLPYGFYHTVIVVHCAKRDLAKKSSADLVADFVIPFRSLISYVRFLVSNEDTPPALKRSKWITVGLICYLVAIVAAWIVWAESRGI